MIRSSGQKAWDAFKHYIVVGLIAIFVILPYYWMISMSLKSPSEIVLSPPTMYPHSPTFNNYVTVWASLPLARYLKNSLIVAVLTTVTCVFIASLCGYSLACFSKRRLQKGTFVLVLLTQLIPGALPFISFYFIMSNARLTNSYAGLVIAYAVWGIPFCTLMMKSYFQSSIPVSVNESATIDGCSRFGIFFKIALPISLPGLVATGIFSFILAWNEYMWASVILSDNMLKPASVGVYDYIGQYGANANVALTVTSAVLMTIPAIVFFAFLQKYLLSGLSAGAVKG